MTVLIVYFLTSTRSLILTATLLSHVWIVSTVTGRFIITNTKITTSQKQSNSDAKLALHGAARKHVTHTQK